MAKFKVILNKFGIRKSWFENLQTLPFPKNGLITFLLNIYGLANWIKRQTSLAGTYIYVAQTWKKYCNLCRPKTVYGVISRANKPC